MCLSFRSCFFFKRFPPIFFLFLSQSSTLPVFIKNDNFSFFFVSFFYFAFFSFFISNSVSMFVSHSIPLFLSLSPLCLHLFHVSTVSLRCFTQITISPSDTGGNSTRAASSNTRSTAASLSLLRLQKRICVSPDAS